MALNWSEVLAVYAVKATNDPERPSEVVTLDEAKTALLRGILRDMNSVTLILSAREVSLPVSGENVTLRVLTVATAQKSAAEAAAYYGFGAEQTALTVEQDDVFSGFAEGVLLEQIKNGYPAARVRSFVNSLFEEGAYEIEAEQIPIKSDSDFILTILAVIRQNERGMPYSIEMKDGRIECNGYLIPNMTISKKEVTNHVE